MFLRAAAAAVVYERWPLAALHRERMQPHTYDRRLEASDCSDNVSRLLHTCSYKNARVLVSERSIEIARCHYREDVPNSSLALQDASNCASCRSCCISSNHEARPRHLAHQCLEPDPSESTHGFDVLCIALNHSLAQLWNSVTSRWCAASSSNSSSIERSIDERERRRTC